MKIEWALGLTGYYCSYQRLWHASEICDHSQTEEAFPAEVWGWDFHICLSCGLQHFLSATVGIHL